MSVVKSNFVQGFIRMATDGNKKLGFPTVAVNTTAGISAELTINYVITDEDHGVENPVLAKN